METRHLKYFVAVAEELHFGKAAKRLHISQPPLSQQIMKFEDELGVTLFERSKRAVSLTSAGKGFLPEAQKILKEIEQAKKKVQAVATGTGGYLELGYIGPALDTPLIEIIKRFKSNFPGVKLGLREMPTTRQLEALRSGDIDVAIVRLFQHDTEGLLCFKFHQESYALVLPNSHRFKSQSSVKISELAEEDLIFFPRHLQPRLYDAWMNVFSSYGFTPKIVQEVATKAASMALAAAGIGISIVPESLGQRALKEVIFKPLIGDFPTLEMHVVYKEKTVHAGRDNFIKIAHQHISQADMVS